MEAFQRRERFVPKLPRLRPPRRGVAYLGFAVDAIMRRGSFSNANPGRIGFMGAAADFLRNMTEAEIERVLDLFSRSFHSFFTSLIKGPIRYPSLNKQNEELPLHKGH